MSMIKVENLSFSYPTGSTPVFENISFQIDTDWKLGFVGRNGRGKTTFFNLLLGKYEYSGKIHASVAFDCFPYEVADKSRETADILRGICPLAEEWELFRELNLLDVGADVLYRPFETLSNGERTKVLLAALFLNEERFLLIDEPTNHLDLAARQRVAAYLNHKKGFILVSHDRRFLDGCTDHILSLNKANIEVQSGNFSSWMQNFEQQQSYEAALNERLQKDVKRLSNAARRAAAWSDKAEAGKYGVGDSGLKADRGYVGHKAAKVMKRSKTVEARRQKAIEQTAFNTESEERLKLAPLVYRADTLAALSDVEIVYDGRKVCPPVSFSIRRGERIALDGKNGCGKSSLLKILVGCPIEHTGTVFSGSGLKISYLPQDASDLCGRLLHFAAENHIDETLFLTILRKMDFNRSQFEKDMSDFSQGQKKKVLIAKSLCESAHLYVWDEPLNYIDLYSRMQIERLIKEFAPTMIFVEHDEAFRDSVATETVKIQ